jgi:aarF domain-containing kinase
MGATIVREFVEGPQKYQDDKGMISPPKVLRRMFEELGATYIKLGQFIASSPTLFPADYVLEFQACLDKTPTIPYSDIRKIIQDELGKPISSVYAYVDPMPLASASIAQVHRGRLKDGTEIVVKVRKPAVEAVLKADLSVLYAATKILEFINPDLGRFSLSNIVGDIRESMLDELDFKKEAKNLENFREFLEKSAIQDATAPRPYLQASSTQVLTMDYLNGVPLVDLEGIRKFSANPELTLVAALRTWASSVTDNDVFHADVHGGNLLVLTDGRVGFIDFGIVGRVPERVWDALGDLTTGFLEEDYRKMAGGLVRMGATGTDVDVDKFGDELESVVQKIMTIQPQVVVASDLQGTQVSAQLAVDERATTEIVLEIVSVADRNGLKLPREFGLLLKQALYFDRYQKLLAPDMDPMRDPRVRERMQEEFFSGDAKPPTEGQGPIIDAEIVG